MIVDDTATDIYYPHAKKGTTKIKIMTGMINKLTYTEHDFFFLVFSIENECIQRVKIKTRTERCSVNM